MRSNNIIVTIVFGSLLAGQLFSCKKAVEVSAPDNSLIGSTVFADPHTATAVMTGVYNNIHTSPCFTDGTSGISTLMGTAADEMKNYYPSTSAIQFYTNNLSSTPTAYFWPQLFQNIYVANAVIENLGKPGSISVDVQHQLLGEAYFTRAFLNFYATCLFGDIPLPTSTDYQVNNTLKRIAQADVYKAIVADLLLAQSLLTEDYMDEQNAVTDEKIRPNKVAATALLARVYLYEGDFQDAETQASAVIEDGNYSLSADLNQVFLKNSGEAIWQLASANPSITNTWDGYTFVLKTAPGVNSHVALSTFILNAFETGDLRRTNWVGTYTKGASTWYYPYKYKNNQTGSPATEYLMVLRIGELYLIRAEARASLGEGNAVDDLNAIRQRAGLSGYSGPTDKTSLLAAILHERQVELFSEWGHRWFDLKRSGNLDGIMGGDNGVCAAKGGQWKSSDALLPLPLSEILSNPNLTQNTGY
jgi:hypothetical protein